MDETSDNFALQAFGSHLHAIFICRKTLKLRASDFTSHPKEGVLCILITFKNPSSLSLVNRQYPYFP
jgi:hypothetical protein